MGKTINILLSSYSFLGNVWPDLSAHEQLYVTINRPILPSPYTVWFLGYFSLFDMLVHFSMVYEE